MKLIFEKSVAGRGMQYLPECDVETVALPASLARANAPKLPEISETDLSRHYTELNKRVHGVNSGFYPLGSCTMKYNPRIDEEMAALPGFTGVHPLAPAHTTEGCQEVISTTRTLLCEITGMDDMTFQPAAGAHGEFTGVLLIKQYHDARGDKKRNKIIVPDSAHGTNPATAAMCGYTIVNIPSAPNGCVDLDALKAVLGDDTAGLMLTNPNTVGIFDENILEITRLVHEAGGLCYYDGANLNAVMGVVRPGDMGFDCIHMNLHKTFATPHGGGGPGAGAVGCKAHLAEFLPKSAMVEEPGHIQVKSFVGNFLVVVKAMTYILTLG
ncbi:MAG: aminomethyl-transferring glycine dehydrogenase subunit GcvPB, partial [Clostridia bacterium]|nr:aminomethyl-transferring glycine dehydrogenase subunit GcvPB [Clostridia bacterium]